MTRASGPGQAIRRVGASAVDRISWTLFDGSPDNRLDGAVTRPRHDINDGAEQASPDARQDAGVQISSSPGQAPQRNGQLAAATLTLPAATESVPAARQFVMDTLTDLGAAGACEDAVALVSELATNAVIHAHTPYTIAVSRDGDTVRVDVHDLCAVIPRRRGYGLDATTGRGLRLVATISSNWGIEAETGGKAVWFEVPSEGSRNVLAWYGDVDLDALLVDFNDGDPDGSSRPPGR